jgi:hypothetical protein
MNQFYSVTGAALILLAAGACETVKDIAEATGRTKVSMTLKNGQKIEGTLLKDQDGQSLVQVNYGSVSVSTGDVASVEKVGVDPMPVSGDGRLSRWDHCLSIVSSHGWSKALVQVPATVIDLGILKNVPYLSHRAGDFEMNIYGDPDRPACLEIGLYRGGVNSVERRKCLDMMCLLLTDPADREALRSVNLEKGLLNRRGMVFEITPPTDKDSYGGWWISVYDEKALAEQRATDKELAAITIAPAQIKPAGTSVGTHPSPTTASPIRWQEHDLKNARPAPSTVQEPLVYKRGVHRKNGTYVVAG